MRGWTTLSLLAGIGLGLAGLGGCDMSQVYSESTGMPGGPPRVVADTMLYSVSRCKKADLKAEWVQSYLLGLAGPEGKPIFDPDRVRAAVPAVLRALSDWGNVRIADAFPGGAPVADTNHWIRDGQLRGEYRVEKWRMGFRVRDTEDLRPVHIPSWAYAGNPDPGPNFNRPPASQPAGGAR
jgi:hypothetical protein